jgi:hypothetical protein
MFEMCSEAQRCSVHFQNILVMIHHNSITEAHFGAVKHLGQCGAAVDITLSAYTHTQRTQMITLNIDSLHHIQSKLIMCLRLHCGCTYLHTFGTCISAYITTRLTTSIFYPRFVKIPFIFISIVLLVFSVSWSLQCCIQTSGHIKSRHLFLTVRRYFTTHYNES